MAREIAETNPLQARWWLNASYQSALEAEPSQAVPTMGKIAATWASVGPGTARQAAQYITGHADDTYLEPSQLVMAAEDVVVADPDLASRLIDLAETRARQPGKGRLGNRDLESVAKTLMAVATAWADSRPERTDPILRHLLEAALAAQSTAYLSITETAAPNPQAVEQLLREYRGPGRDHLLCTAASVSAATDAHRAEQLTQEITDDALRYAALDILATSIIKQANRCGCRPLREARPIAPYPLARPNPSNRSPIRQGLTARTLSRILNQGRPLMISPYPGRGGQAASQRR
ncbi:hypothetical protein ACIBQ1_40905 [Nonomuraea sp. NPDC050153]|uniref:hypothetical protein n=1 Tax=Nonomuraea sp. NPDC050153 TaxID=3364359 RepID=UPI0037B0DB47